MSRVVPTRGTKTLSFLFICLSALLIYIDITYKSFEGIKNSYKSFAISSTSPTFFSIVCEITFLRYDSLNSFELSGHRIGPGATAFTLILGPSSWANDLVRVVNPDLAIE